jgi:DNA polymerase alpha subunit B
VSNPCTLKINELTIGVTSSDVLFHISSDECNANLPPGTRMTRIAQHLIQQRSYYPLFPAAKGASLDLGKANQWEMPCQPDILIVPSKLASFAKPVLDRTIVVNPGELTKNTSGGTYATIDVHPMKRETLEDAVEADMEMLSGIQDRVRVDIKRI